MSRVATYQNGRRRAHIRRRRVGAWRLVLIDGAGRRQRREYAAEWGARVAARAWCRLLTAGRPSTRKARAADAPSPLDLYV